MINEWWFASANLSSFFVLINFFSRLAWFDCVSTCSKWIFPVLSLSANDHSLLFTSPQVFLCTSLTFPPLRFPNRDCTDKHRACTFHLRVHLLQSPSTILPSPTSIFYLNIHLPRQHPSSLPANIFFANIIRSKSHINTVCILLTSASLRSYISWPPRLFFEHWTFEHDADCALRSRWPLLPTVLESRHPLSPMTRHRDLLTTASIWSANQQS